jgi:hypothetical protein
MIAEPAAMPDKTFANLRARAALAAIELYQIEGDNGRPILIATRWALTKQFESLSEVEAWLDRVTGRRA